MIAYDNSTFISITNQIMQKRLYLNAMFCSPTANFIRHMVTSRDELYVSRGRIDAIDLVGSDFRVRYDFWAIPVAVGARR